MSKKKQSIIIVAVLAVLIVLCAVLVLLQRQQVDDKLALLSINQQLLVTTADGSQVSFVIEDVMAQPQLVFEATRKSNGKQPEAVSFTGVSLPLLLASKEIALSATDTVTLRSVDGYSVTFGGDEVLDEHNLALVYTEGGEALGSPDEGGSGPYMVVVRNDPFSQRWSKMLTEIIIANK